jgi:hypothetical protein
VLLGLLLVILNLATGVRGQEVVPTPIPAPSAPVWFPDGAFVPADVLLKQADARHPPTAEGWIVQGDPTDSWLRDIDPAKRSLEHAKYLFELRQYDSQIRIARSVVDLWRRRLNVYSYFNKAGALLLPMENAYIALITAQEDLKNLRYQRTLFVREHYLQKRAMITADTVHEQVIGPT